MTIYKKQLLISKSWVLVSITRWTSGSHLPFLSSVQSETLELSSPQCGRNTLLKITDCRKHLRPGGCKFCHPKKAKSCRVPESPFILRALFLLEILRKTISNSGGLRSEETNFRSAEALTGSPVAKSVKTQRVNNILILLTTPKVWCL